MKAPPQQLTPEQQALLDEVVRQREVYDAADQKRKSAELVLKHARDFEREGASATLEETELEVRTAKGERNKAIRAAAEAGCELRTISDAVLYSIDLLETIIAGRPTR
jgi:hypothetical protein